MRRTNTDERPCFPAQTTSPPPDDSLCEALDRVLDTGAVVDGNLTVSVADVDLLYLDLRLLLASFDAARRAGAVTSDPGGRRSSGSPPPSGRPAPSDTARCPAPPADAVVRGVHVPDRDGRPLESADSEAHPVSAQSSKESLGNGLARLVLTLINLLHELLERQALRRMAGGSLSDGQIERLGLALMGQAAEIDHLRDVFGLGREDLRLSLGTAGHSI